MPPTHLSKNSPGSSLLLALITSTLLMNAAYAKKDKGGHRGPPAEAIEACAALVAGDTCSFVGRHDKELTGVCFTPKEDKELACKPEGHEKHKHHKDKKNSGDEPSDESSDESDE
jgi:hypothetical protein